jgi:cyclophilin family peptidyl-prolyl cis-trans isomerase
MRSNNSLTGEKSASTELVQVQTKDGIGGDLNPPIFFGTSFLYPIQISRLSALTALSVSGLPSGLVYDSGTHSITGRATEEGVKTVTLKATFSDASTTTRSLVLRIIRPPTAPLVTNAFTAVNVAVAASSTVSVSGKFSDPDTTSAARLNTSLGAVDIILYSLATPETVGNFLDYVDASLYNNSFFHRSIDNSNESLIMLQGGGYKYTSGAGFLQVAKFNKIVKNEPGISNLQGTLAMAKVANNPDSATSEFFVNVNDVNAENLDTQNDGFTVFGRVTNAGMQVIQAIHDLPTHQYSIPPFGAGPFENVPMNAATAPAYIEADKLVKINSVSAAPILTYEVRSLNTAVANATITGTEITITGVAAGSTSIGVTATDLEGNSVSQNIEVLVP